MIWEMFKSTIVNSVVHLGQDCQEDVRTNNSTHFEHVTQLFHISQKLLLNQSEEIFETRQSRQVVERRGTRFL